MFRLLVLAIMTSMLFTACGGDTAADPTPEPAQAIAVEATPTSAAAEVEPTATATPESEPTATATVEPTASPTAEPTATSEPSPTPEPTATLEPSPTPEPEREGYELVTVFGVAGAENGLEYPIGVTVDAGKVYVVDFWRSSVYVHDTGGNLLSSWGGEGTQQGQFINPVDIAVYSADNQWAHVTDVRTGVVQRLTPDGEYIAHIAPPGGAFGVAFQYPYLYVTGRSGNSVARIDAYFIIDSTWSASGVPGGFNNLAGIDIDSDGNLYIADSGNHRIVKLSADGAFIAEWGEQGAGEGQFDNPFDVSIDSSGNVYVVDQNNHRVQKFTANGEYLTEWSTLASYSVEDKALPQGIAIDAEDNVYVTFSNFPDANGDPSMQLVAGVMKFTSSGGGQ